MDAREIIEATRQLPLGQQKQIANSIVWNIDKIEHRMDAAERYAVILQTAEAVTNMRNDPTRKDSDSVFVRTLTVWRMIEEGYSKMDVSRASGKNHATIVYLDKIRKAAREIPAAYKAHLNMYNKLIIALNNGND